VPGRSAHLWLLLLAVGSQVIGWLLIGSALPKLPATETSVLLLGQQPVFAVIWGVLVFGEQLSTLQWAGAAIVLTGVAMLSVGGARVQSAASGYGGDRDNGIRETTKSRRRRDHIEQQRNRARTEKSVFFSVTSLLLRFSV
jgi:multidrug transporter EmrE-like cation transporter